LAAAPPPGVKWIAHRGGVVDARYSENSPALLEAAIQHGYWMIESDIRETKDG
jgi:glycerophosphoryl diester phosphodiesterase